MPRGHNWRDSIPVDVKLRASTEYGAPIMTTMPESWWARVDERSEQAAKERAQYFRERGKYRILQERGTPKTAGAAQRARLTRQKKAGRENITLPTLKFMEKPEL